MSSLPGERGRKRREELRGSERGRGQKGREVRDRKGGEKRKISLSQAGEASEAERCLWPGCALYNPTYTIFKTTKSC